MSVTIVLAAVAMAVGEPRELPIVEEVEWRSLRQACRLLLALPDGDASPFPVQTRRQLRMLLDREADDAKTAVRDAQKLVDPYCLLLVGINAESRVKAARGPAVVRLRRQRATLVLLKIDNEAGVTHALRVQGPELIEGEQRGGARWLQAQLLTERPFAAALSGRRLEYRVLKLTPRQFGKREATFRFDVGQGTQDLGFRAETPILFSVERAPP